MNNEQLAALRAQADKGEGFHHITMLTVLRHIDAMTARVAQLEALDASKLRGMLEAMQAGELTVSRGMELLDMWQAGNYSDEHLPTFSQNEALDWDTLPLDLIRSLQMRVAELEAQQKAFLVTPFGDVTLLGGKEALLWAEEFARKMKGPAVPAVAVPDDHVLLPKEPSKATLRKLGGMQTEYLDDNCRRYTNAIGVETAEVLYRGMVAMLSSTPKPSIQPWPEDTEPEYAGRLAAISQNGNDGLHYQDQEGGKDAGA